MSTRITPAPYRVFVYGTLKQGFSNHEYYCRGVTAIDEAVIYGRLYALSAQIPTLMIPEASVLAQGSLAYTEDLRHQQELAAAIVGKDQTIAADIWRMIYGEVLTFSDSERLARLDQLEGFHPPDPCLYRRVLAPVQLTCGEWIAAWVYTIGDIDRSRLVSVTTGCWR